MNRASASLLAFVVVALAGVLAWHPVVRGETPAWLAEVCAKVTSC